MLCETIFHFERGTANNSTTNMSITPNKISVTLWFYLLVVCTDVCHLTTYSHVHDIITEVCFCCLFVCFVFLPQTATVKTVNWVFQLCVVQFGLYGVLQWTTQLVTMDHSACYNGPLSLLQWTTQLVTMDHSACYNGPLSLLQWATQVVTMDHSGCYNGPLSLLQWTTQLVTMDHSACYNGPLSLLQWTTQLVTMDHSACYNGPLSLLQ